MNFSLVQNPGTLAKVYFLTRTRTNKSICLLIKTTKLTKEMFYNTLALNIHSLHAYYLVILLG